MLCLQFSLRFFSACIGFVIPNSVTVFVDVFSFSGFTCVLSLFVCVLVRVFFLFLVSGTNNYIALVL